MTTNADPFRELQVSQALIVLSVLTAEKRILRATPVDPTIMSRKRDP